MPTQFEIRLPKIVYILTCNSVGMPCPSYQPTGDIVLTEEQAIEWVNRCPKWRSYVYATLQETTPEY